MGGETSIAEAYVKHCVVRSMSYWFHLVSGLDSLDQFIFKQDWNSLLFWLWSLFTWRGIFYFILCYAFSCLGHIHLRFYFFLPVDVNIPIKTCNNQYLIVGNKKYVSNTRFCILDSLYHSVILQFSSNFLINF